MTTALKIKLIERLGYPVVAVSGLVSGLVVAGALCFLLRWSWSALNGPLQDGTPQDQTWMSIFGFASPFFFGGPALATWVLAGTALDYWHELLEAKSDAETFDEVVRGFYEG